MVVKIVTVKVQRGKEAEFVSLMNSIMPLVRQEKGTLQFEMIRSQEESGKFLLYEKYADKEAQEIHESKPYLKEM